MLACSSVDRGFGDLPSRTAAVVMALRALYGVCVLAGLDFVGLAVCEYGLGFDAILLHHYQKRFQKLSRN
jgi:hypothetical protein